MTLDEAIEHAKEVARTCEDGTCAADHAQLAEWLRQARGADAAARWYTKKIRELESDRERMFNANVEKNNEILRLLTKNKTLRELVIAFADCRNTTCDDCVRWDYPEGGCSLDGVMRKLGIEVN